ncbi:MULTISPECIES: glycosyltransferase family 25 protein [unclassified Rhizobium]|uniref:glycosyltransferase family 25 protein n=1 Tax=unclassified Rhizobium TaxID=2613769 RepID=UPI00161D03BE|nr:MULTISPECIES: glycosyltransferase family 25 protein [unclassified Rhizobium]MBB3540978.1 glycosyl transferase family 25 [Rhizobium sp. BK399]MCS3741365.1 glycosyl transferase family 25 [Rhizobium sp. BK661]MCS4093818.1 glycosyl transferase family 25 [Rhizobium sp. BK176]
MKILIISRKAEEKRREFQSRQMQKLGLDFEFLDAFEAGDLSVEECQKAANTWPSPTLREDVACFTSHRMAWKVIIERNERTLILEDDAVLSENFNDAIRSIKGRGDNWDRVYDLEFAPRPHILARSPVWTDGIHRATRVFQNRVGTAGYIIGPRAAAKMLADTKNYALIDAYFWHRAWLKAYQIEPAPVVQMQFLDGSADRSAFVRKSIDRAFTPQGRLRKNLLRLWLESIKARNLVRGWLGGEKRPLQIDRASFVSDAEPAATASA